ncbi:Proline utilization trans-activator [Colletotrichum sp. SAR11_239]|nr:Proline utilization trans-activator [Colletotrichum sp. SAR11_239]
MSQPTFSPTFERIRAVEVLPASTSSPVRTARAIAPESALSSSETFGSEIKTLLVSRSNPGSAASPSTNTGVTPLPHIDRRGLLEAIGPWPTEEEAHAMLDTVVFNVGISQQLFDVRAFSDNLAVLYQETSANAGRSQGLSTNESVAIYSQKDDPETMFINNVQNILHSLYEVEKTMPSEYFMEIRPAGVLVAGRPFMDAPTTTSRTSSSLYTSVYMAVIHTNAKTLETKSAPL